MSSGHLHRLSFDQLPRQLPIFPLAGVLLLPGGQLPLHIFEPRYRQMTEHALEGERLIGMVQPTKPQSRAERPAIYGIGCAGRIVANDKLEDGRYNLTITGLCRFDVVKELTTQTLYRQIIASFDRFKQDLDDPVIHDIDRSRLLNALRIYLQLGEIAAEWTSVEAAPVDTLVNSLAMVCPFQPNEKQALLEAIDLSERARVLTALLEMSLLAPQAASRRPTSLN